MIHEFFFSCLGPLIIGHALSWYDGSLHHLVYHSSVTAPGCNAYHSDIIVQSDNVWIPEMLNSTNTNGLSSSSSPIDTPISNNLVVNEIRPSLLAQIPSDDSDEDDRISDPVSTFHSSYLQSIPNHWETSINGNDFLPVYNHHHQQQQQQQQQAQQPPLHHHHHHEPGTSIYEDDHAWYERLRSMATSISTEQQSSSDSSSNDIQQHHHQLFDVYSQHLPPPMITSAVNIDPHGSFYSNNHGFDPYHHHHHHHHLSEYQTMFSF